MKGCHETFVPLLATNDIEYDNIHWAVWQWQRRVVTVYNTRDTFLLRQALNVLWHPLFIILILTYLLILYLSLLAVYLNWYSAYYVLRTGYILTAIGTSQVFL